MTDESSERHADNVTAGLMLGCQRTNQVWFVFVVGRGRESYNQNNWLGRHREIRGSCWERGFGVKYEHLWLPRLFMIWAVGELDINFSCAVQSATVCVDQRKKNVCVCTWIARVQHDVLMQSFFTLRHFVLRHHCDTTGDVMAGGGDGTFVLKRGSCCLL